MTDKLLYFRRTIEVVSLLAALVVIGVYWRDVPAVVVPTLLGLIGVALGVGQAPMGNPTIAIKSTPPPPPDPPRVDTIPAPPPVMEEK